MQSISLFNRSVNTRSSLMSVVAFGAVCMTTLACSHGCYAASLPHKTDTHHKSFHATKAPHAKKSNHTISPINLNTADAKTIRKSMPGVGKKLAAAIVAYRRQHGDFKSLDELTNVRGVSKKSFKRYAKSWHKMVYLTQQEPALKKSVKIKLKNNLTKLAK